MSWCAERGTGDSQRALTPNTKSRTTLMDKEIYDRSEYTEAERFSWSKEFYEIYHKAGIKLDDREKELVARFYVTAKKLGFPSAN